MTQRSGTAQPLRSLADIRATGAAWITESELSRVLDLAETTAAMVAAVREAIAELRLRASATNEFGQIDPPYTAFAVTSLADELQRSVDAEAAA